MYPTLLLGVKYRILERCLNKYHKVSTSWIYGTICVNMILLAVLLKDTAFFHNQLKKNPEPNSRKHKKHPPRAKI